MLIRLQLCARGQIRAHLLHADFVWAIYADSESEDEFLLYLSAHVSSSVIDFPMLRRRALYIAKSCPRVPMHPHSAAVVNSSVDQTWPSCTTAAAMHRDMFMLIWLFTLQRASDACSRCRWHRAFKACHVSPQLPRCLFQIGHAGNQRSVEVSVPGPPSQHRRWWLHNGC